MDMTHQQLQANLETIILQETFVDQKDFRTPEGSAPRPIAAHFSSSYSIPPKLGDRKNVRFLQDYEKVNLLVYLAM